MSMPVIKDRKIHPKEGSYTNYLFDKGIDKILKKVGEECTEIVIAAKNPDPEEIKYEISDFLYHAMVLMVQKGVDLGRDHGGTGKSLIVLIGFGDWDLEK